MTVYTWPTAREFCPEGFTPRLLDNSRVVPAMFAGSDQTIELPGAKWQFVLTMTNAESAARAAMEAWLNRLRGPAHRVNVWHLRRQVPRGTLQSNTTLAAAAEQFDTTIQANAITGLTLLAGDMLGVLLEDTSPALVQAVQDTVSVDGVMQVEITPPLKWSATAGAAVTVIRPMVRCRLVESPAIPYVPGYAPSFQIELVEA